MFIVQISGVDSSCHTQELDAEAQQARFLATGAIDVVIVEKDSFNPSPSQP
jgi:hypothetical protein